MTSIPPPRRWWRADERVTPAQPVRPAYLAWVSRMLTSWSPAGVRRSLTSFTASLVIHLALMLLLTLMYVTSRSDEDRWLWFAAPAEDFSLDEGETFVEVLVQDGPRNSAELAADQASETLLELSESTPTLPAPAAGSTVAAETATAAELQPASESSAGQPTALDGRGGFQGRTGDAKAKLLSQFGGSRETEDAVEMALAWLAAHQRRDGSWRFTFDGGTCNGRCRHPGSVGSTTGATALALLPFLGAGHMPAEGPYGEVVKNGLYYLRGRLLRTPHGGDLQEGTMYAQGLAAIALCEAYAMSRQEELRPTAQWAIDFIANVQHSGGGWRYYPGQPGDTTVFGWQLMALKSAQLGGLTVPSPTIDGAKRYLDSVQSGQGAFYGYLKPGQERGPTAVGLLSRMYFGWSQDDPRLKRGVAYLAKLGPSQNDMYFNYYAAQVLRHHGGQEWRTFNERLREHLLATQARNDHERGSWHFAEKHGDVGGRLYTTSICAMILEVYYRHMPLYGEDSVRSGF